MTRDEQSVWTEYHAESEALRQQAKADAAAAVKAVWTAFYGKVNELRLAAEAELAALESRVAEARAEASKRPMDKTRV